MKTRTEQSHASIEVAEPWLELRDLVSARTDIVSLLILVISVAVVFAIPALLNHPSVSADNLIQNFPLRVLSGQQIAAGHLPLWNPLSFSGTPLLGSMNAGSLFPLTIPFAFLPGILIWTVNLMACYWASAVGVYLVARYFSIDARGSLFAALVFTFMGAQWGQMVHLGVIQGQGLLPWALLAMVMIGDRVRSPLYVLRLRSAPTLLWPIFGLACVTGLVMLSGEPRAIADLEMLGLIVGVYGAVISKGLRAWRTLWTIVAYAVAVGWGALIGAVQILPGYSFIGISQRSNLGYNFFGSGSTALHHLALMGVPLFYGTNGALGQDRYFADYNLPEITGYIGLLGLVAVVAAALELLRRGSSRGPRHLWLLVGMAIAGILLATATATPLGHLFYAIPLWGKTRLQSRSIVFFDLAGALLVGWFVQGFIEGASKRISMLGWRRWVSLSPVFVVGLALIGVIAVPTHVLARLHIAGALLGNGAMLRGIYVANLFLVVAVVVVLVRGGSLSLRGRSFAITSVILVDLVFFVVFATTGLTSGNSQVTPTQAYASSYLGSNGRFAMVDNPGGNIDQAVAMGLPNLNVFTQLPSVQGYGSLIASSYGALTKDHTQQTLGACEFLAGNFKNLRLASMSVSAAELIQRFSPLQGSMPSAAPKCAGAPSPTKHGSRVFFFGRQLTMSSVSVSMNLGTHLHAGDVQVMVRNTLGTKGYLGNWYLPPQQAMTIPGGVELHLHHAVCAVAMKVVTSASGSRGVTEIGDSTHVVTASPTSYWAMGGGMQDAMDSSDWHLSRMAGSVAIFKAPSVKPLAWISSGRVISASMSRFGSEQAVVNATRQATLYFSESALPGWHATITPLGGGASQQASVASSNGIQSIPIPSGAWKVNLIYRAPRLSLGLAATGIGTIAWLLCGGYLIITRRRRRSSARG